MKRDYSYEFKAFAAAQRLLDTLESINFDFSNPYVTLCDDEICPDYLFWGSGASRYVVWDDNYDFAIKFARTSYYERYNDAEVDLYNRAKELGIERNFARIMKYLEAHLEDDGTYIPSIYVVEYLNCNDEEVDDCAWEYGYEDYCRSRGLDGSCYEYADDFNDIRDDMSDVKDYFYSQMSNEEKVKVINFIIDNAINDLHCANFGFRGDKLVISDYAGWGW